MIRKIKVQIEAGEIPGLLGLEFFDEKVREDHAAIIAPPRTPAVPLEALAFPSLDTGLVWQYAPIGIPEYEVAQFTLSDPMIEEVSKLFLALSDPSRLRILRCLLNAKGALSQGAIADETGLSQANASKHLAFLVRVGLAIREPEGNTVFFSPVLPLVEEVCHLVCDHVSERVKAAYQAIK